MFGRLLLFPLLLILLAAPGAMGQEIKIKVPPRVSSSNAERGVLLVKVRPELYRQGLSPSLFGDVARRYGIFEVRNWLQPKLIAYGLPAYKTAVGERDGAFSLLRILKVEYSALDFPERVAEAIAALPGVEYAEPVYPRTPLLTTNDPGAYKQWYLDSINARKAWDVARADSTIIIAITDTGVERLHEDLREAIWYNPGEAGDEATNGEDDDNNGLIDDWWGYDFAGSNGRSPDNDPSGAGEEHGTEVAGIAAARGNNALGITGVAFGARIMAVKVTDDRPFPNTKVYGGAEGVLYAAKMGAKIINCSWGGANPSRAEEEVFTHVVFEMKRLVVAAAGNSSSDMKYYPSSYPGVLSVAAVNEGNGKADFSNYDYTVDISAPGTDVYTSIFGAYGYDKGTSFATPMVSGAAALLCKRYPELFTPTADIEKVQEILMASADNIDAELGSIYRGKMGTGRLNILRALEAPGTIASARMVNYTLVESVADDVVEPGETIRIQADIKNILAPASSVRATLSSVTNVLQINGTDADFGAMGSGDVRTTGAGTFEIVIPSDIEPNSEIVFKIEVQTDDRTNLQFITLRAAPTFMTTDLNQIAATFNSTGNIGYDGMDQDEGEGFRFGNSESLIYHGGLMIGTDPSHLPNVVRVGGLSDGVADGFRPTKLYRLQMAPDSSVQTGTAAFNDSHLPADSRLGVDVELTTREYRNEPDRNIVLAIYRITNTSGAPIEGLRCGLYLDWDVSGTGYNDQAIYDAEHKLALVRDPDDATLPYVGSTLLARPEMGFYAVDNDDISTFFGPIQKWTMMSSGVHEDLTISDVATVVSGGPVNLAPGESTVFAFGLLAAEDFQGLRAAADRAQQLYLPAGVERPAPGGIAAITPLPNPFGSRTTFSIEMAEGGDASLLLYNLRGEQVATIFRGRLEAGVRSIPFSGEELPAGVYMYELQANGMVQRGKVVKGDR